MSAFDPAVAYNELPPLPPANPNLETPEVLKACINARVALAELKQAAELIPNASVLVNALPMLEARASSEIENIVTTTDNMFRYLEAAEGSADSATKEALRYRRALFEGAKMVRKGPITAEMAVKICGTIKNASIEVRANPGTSLRNNTTGEVVYRPPEGRPLLLDKLENWAEFLDAKSVLDPLVRLAVQHYQFEAIHPFADGNGRTGRVINVLYLVQQGLLDKPILYLSRYIIQNKAEYYRGLLEVTADDAWEPWILFMLRGIEDTCLWTTDKIRAIRELMAHTAEYVQRQLPKIYSWELVQLLFMQPYCRIAHVVERDIAKRQTASVYLKQLVDIGILNEVRAGRESLFVHPKYIELLSGDENVWVYYTGIETETARHA
jgi:Fic family protein